MTVATPNVPFLAQRVPAITTVVPAARLARPIGARIPERRLVALM
jgi:hypothetical protein